MKKITADHFGPLLNLDITLGDLTILVGPQATGKSLFLQLIKLIADKNNIRKILEQYGFIWGNLSEEIFNRYFGEGMASVWSGNTRVTIDGKSISEGWFQPKQRENIKDSHETMFYIPAQRVICLQNGWPRFFTDYEDSVPYVLRHFSETLRLLMESSLSKYSDIVFPKSQRLSSHLREAFNKSIFHDGKITVEKLGKKRFKMEVGSSSIPYLAWSAGQKEFMPLLLSFYHLCPPSKTPRRDQLKYVIMEEPEMGLHPQAISAILLQTIELLSRDYKVIISTHSPLILEFAWAVRNLQESGSSEAALYDLFGVKRSSSLDSIFASILRKKEITSYAFVRTPQGVTAKDISTLDAGSTDPDISEWGGLSSFSAKASEIISGI